MIAKLALKFDFLFHKFALSAVVGQSNQAKCVPRTTMASSIIYSKLNPLSLGCLVGELHQINKPVREGLASLLDYLCPKHQHN